MLDPLQLDFLWEALQSGEPPYPLEVPVHGATEEERAALRQEVAARPVDPRVAGWLAVLAGAECSIDSVYHPDGAAAPVRALAAVRGRAAVLAVQSGPGLALRPIEPSSLVWTIVAELPPGQRGSERSVSLPSTEFSGLGVRAGLRGGQIAANARSRAGVRRRSPVLGWFDDGTGRYFGQVLKGWMTLAPADAPALRKRISEMMTGVTDGGR
ncbi:ESX secretion-associated protein EspG [Actinophytocola sp.]|uniref:ESX secretion-associated protein EspG n=1 Tax=Actinophytocola sp. TaxID=1872138 RepID=UPI002D80A9F3|nr:ESX secretion-associated protein EspG [Actinophytocola sp.]HET9139408.1 ESX secretion-associated protein EspG [Actinophytocola sp.]